jgi:hypothetical protein
MGSDGAGATNDHGFGICGHWITSLVCSPFSCYCWVPAAPGSPGTQVQWTWGSHVCVPAHSCSSGWVHYAVKGKCWSPVTSLLSYTGHFNQGHKGLVPENWFSLVSKQQYSMVCVIIICTAVHFTCGRGEGVRTDRGMRGKGKKERKQLFIKMLRQSFFSPQSLSIHRTISSQLWLNINPFGEFIKVSCPGHTP